MIIFLGLMIAYLVGVLCGYGIKCEERNQMQAENTRLKEQVNRLRIRGALYDPVNCRCSVKVKEESK